MTLSKGFKYKNRFINIVYKLLYNAEYNKEKKCLVQ